MTCQIDYLCEVPTDSARRKALDTLPPTLDATYARILRRVQESNHDVQVMVQRSLRWIAHARRPLHVTELCEAISIDPGDTFINREGIPAVEEILRCCSSLVRKSADGYSLEFAHFTVEEYLQKLDPLANNEFGAYHIKDQPCQIELAEVCLTYLNLDDFRQVDITDKEAWTRRMEDYALRSYAVEEWQHHAGEKMANETVFRLIQQLFSPSKSGNFMTWAQDYSLILDQKGFRMDFKMGDFDRRDIDISTFDAVNFRLATTGPLHFAALLAMPALCTWLLDEKCDVNQKSPCGTPLQCTIFGVLALDGQLIEMRLKFFGVRPEKSSIATLKILLERGADPNCYYDDGQAKQSLLGNVAYLRWKYACFELLRHGAVVREDARSHFENWIGSAEDYTASKFTEEYGCKDIGEVGYSSTQERTLASEAFANISSSNSRTQVRKLEYGAIINHFRLAAKFGQLDDLTEMLLDSSLDINAAEIGNGRTALHYAAENGHSNIVASLLAHGADSNMVDNDGRTPISLATKASRPDCFLSLLQRGFNISAEDFKGYTMIHHAAKNGNITALLALKEHLDLSATSQCSKAVMGPITPLYVEPEIVEEPGLLTGQNFLEALSQKSADGRTPLHVAVEEGSLDVLRFLLDSNCDPKALMRDGSTALHCIAEYGDPKESHLDVLNVLLELQVDPCQVRCDGAAPLHVIIQNLCHERHYRSTSLLILETFARQEGTLRKVNTEGLTALHLLIRTFFGFLDNYDDVSEEEEFWEIDSARWELLLTPLLDAGADLQAVDPQNRSALYRLLSTFTATTTALGQDTLSQMISIAIDHVDKDESNIKILTEPALLVMAIRYGKSGLVRKLLDMSPQVDLKAATIPSMTPIQAACKYGCNRKNLLRLLDLSKARSDPAGLGSELLRLACQSNKKGASNSVLVLLEAGFDPSNRSSKGENALMLAAQAGNVDIVKLLISHEVDPSISDAKGCNVAHYALDRGHVHVAYALRHCKLNWGAKGEMSIYGQTLQDVTALHLVAKHVDSTLLEYLVDQKLIDIDCVTKEGVTPLFIAVWSSLPRNVAVLLSKQANAAVISTLCGESPFHLATRLGNRDIVFEFLRYGCDASIPDDCGLDCEMIALKHGHKDMAKMIADFVQEQGMCRSHTH